MNTPQLNGPNTNFGNANFGKITQQGNFPALHPARCAHNVLTKEQT
jgi:hypothetical protein